MTTTCYPLAPLFCLTTAGVLMGRCIWNGPFTIFTSYSCQAICSTWHCAARPFPSPEEELCGSKAWVSSQKLAQCKRSLPAPSLTAPQHPQKSGQAARWCCMTTRDGNKVPSKPFKGPASPALPGGRIQSPGRWIRLRPDPPRRGAWQAMPTLALRKPECSSSRPAYAPLSCLRGGFVLCLPARPSQQRYRS